MDNPNKVHSMYGESVSRLRAIELSPRGHVVAANNACGRRGDTERVLPCKNQFSDGNPKNTERFSFKGSSKLYCWSRGRCGRVAISSDRLTIPRLLPYHSKDRVLPLKEFVLVCGPTLGLHPTRTGHAIWDWTGTIKSADTTHNSQDAIRMLNERQTQVVVDKVNDDINLPLVSESREERIIEKLVDKLMPKVEPALHAIMPTVYVTCIKMALDERLSLKERRERISDLLRAELAEPLSRELNERVDCSMVPEGLEGKVLKIVANKVIDEFVEWTVGEVSYKLA